MHLNKNFVIAFAGASTADAAIKSFCIPKTDSMDSTKLHIDIISINQEAMVLQIYSLRSNFIWLMNTNWIITESHEMFV